MKYPVASFEDDKRINIKMATRSLVAHAMISINAIAAYYESGVYWFIIPGAEEPLSALQIANYYKGTATDLFTMFMAIDYLSIGFQYIQYPNAPPIIDPIYFGT